MPTKHDTEIVVSNADNVNWYCVHCEAFLADFEVTDDHDYSFNEPVCDHCDADVVPAEDAYKFD